MKDQHFSCYAGSGSSLSGYICDGRLYLDSEIYGGDDFYDSESHYVFSKEETDRLFSIISLDDFISLCRSSHLLGMEEFLQQHGIKYGNIVI